MKAIARFLMPALVLALVSIFGSTITASAQDFPPPIGEVITCNFNGPIVINQDGRDFLGTVSGFGAFQVVTTTDNVAQLRPVEINATSDFPELGTFTTTLNRRIPEDQQPISNVIFDGDQFIVPMIYDPVVTGPDGLEYIGGTVNFFIDGSNSFNPIVDQTSRLEGSVTFQTADGSSSFTLVSLDATFNN
jgi:hypothetical protein